ncbi:MAG: hypothetical protein EA403_02005 [Spirochaetaceae bacterium]|nr:MAG: hypothetical protein EA403_02005 [Spirochaetaceae bacterium]
MRALPDTIIPAAGASQRMGQWKPGLPWRGGWVVDAVVNAARSAGSRVVLVAHDERLPERFGGRTGVDLVHNPYPDRGMFSSIQCGMAAVRTDWCFVLPADMPLVPVEVFALLHRAAEHHMSHATVSQVRDRDFPAVRPVRDGAPGHPVLLPPAVVARVRTLPPDSTMRDALSAAAMVDVAVEDRGVIIDLDTDEEYRRYRDDG